MIEAERVSRSSLRSAELVAATPMEGTHGADTALPFPNHSKALNTPKTHKNAAMQLGNAEKKRISQFSLLVDSCQFVSSTNACNVHGTLPVLASVNYISIEW